MLAYIIQKRYEEYEGKSIEQNLPPGALASPVARFWPVVRFPLGTAAGMPVQVATVSRETPALALGAAIRVGTEPTADCFQEVSAMRPAQTRATARGADRSTLVGGNGRCWFSGC